MKHKKILVLALAALITTWAVASTHAFDSKILTDEEKTEIREIFSKLKNGETLNSYEQALVDEVKEYRKEHRRSGFKWFWKRKGFKNLTDEEKSEIENMSDAEKKAFFEAKKGARIIEKEAKKVVIDGLLNGEILRPEQTVLRVQMLKKMEEHPGRRWGEHREIIKKLLQGETLSNEERAEIEEMKAKHADRKEKKMQLRAVFQKVKNGETLSEDEQELLYYMKEGQARKGGDWNWIWR